MATGVRGPKTSAATATKPEEQAPHALDAAPCEGRLDDPCPALSALRQSTGHRPASTVTNSARSRIPTRASFKVCEPCTILHQIPTPFPYVLAPSGLFALAREREACTVDLRGDANPAALQSPFGQTPVSRQRPWDANTLIRPSLSNANTLYDCTLAPWTSMPGDPIGMPGTASPMTPAGRSFNRR